MQADDLEERGFDDGPKARRARTRRPTPWMAVTSLAAVLLAPASARAVEVEATVSAVPGGYHYAIAIANDLGLDLVVVSLVDAPKNDATLETSLSAPKDRVSSYDAGLGIVDLAEAALPIAAGQTTTGFSFESASAPAPGVFETFHAYTTNADLVVGSIKVVPEPGFVRALLVGLGYAGLLARSRRT
jgi:hypothetical protein